MVRLECAITVGAYAKIPDTTGKPPKIEGLVNQGVCEQPVGIYEYNEDNPEEYTEAYFYLVYSPFFIRDLSAEDGGVKEFPITSDDLSAWIKGFTEKYGHLLPEGSEIKTGLIVKDYN